MQGTNKNKFSVNCFFIVRISLITLVTVRVVYTSSKIAEVVIGEACD